METTLKSKVDAATKAMQRESREWKDLLAAVRAGADHYVLLPLAEAALVGVNRLAEIKRAFAWAKSGLSEAERWPSVEKEWDGLTADLAELRRRFALSTNEQDRYALDQKAVVVGQKIDNLRWTYNTTKQAANMLATLRQEGILP